MARASALPLYLMKQEGFVMKLPLIELMAMVRAHQDKVLIDQIMRDTKKYCNEHNDNLSSKELITHILDNLSEIATYSHTYLESHKTLDGMTGIHPADMFQMIEMREVIKDENNQSNSEVSVPGDGVQRASS
jgi:hypothetical protein